MRNSFLFATMAFICAPLVHSQEPVSSNVSTVEQFIAAFNMHDSEAMAKFVAEDILWLNITGQDVAVEVAGKSELVASMNAYFESCLTCQSALSGILSLMTG